MSIQPLPPEVIAQIKSSTTITSLNGVISELLKNSLDAFSTKVEITVDYSRGSCIVEDDGLGILPLEFGESGGLGKMHHSSKLSSQPPVHGGHGTYIASLSAMSLLSVTSRHHEHQSHNTITMHKSSVVSRQTPAPPQQHLSFSNHGTRVTVRDLFGNMPVRVKQRAIAADKRLGNSKEWDELRQDSVLLLLAWPQSVAVTVRDAGTNERVFIRGKASSSSSIDQIDLSAVCAILSQASIIAIEDKSFWVSARASTQKIGISAAISLLPSASKHIQFISFGIQPLVSHETKSVLHTEINRLFLNSAFGNDEESVELEDSERDRRAKDRRYKGDGYTNKELKGGKKSIDRWPMFYIKIEQDLHSGGGKHANIEDVLDDKENSLSSIVELLQALIWEFLTKHHFRPRASRRIRSKNSPNASSGSWPNRETAEASAKRIPNMRRSRGLGGLAPRSQKNSLPRLETANEQEYSSLPAPAPKDDPFESWTRVKRGSKSTFFNVLEKGFDIAIEGPSILRPFSAPPGFTNGLSSPTTTPSRRSATPLMSSSGKIIRRPFGDVATRLQSPRKQLALPPPLEEPPTSAGDDVVAWVNPITKVESLVNQRTGLTVRSHKTTTSNSSRQSPSANFQSNHRILRTKSFSSSVEASPWLHNILTSWNNPVFAPAEPSIPQLSFEAGDAGTGAILHGRHHHCSQIDIDKAFKESSTGIDGRISKSALSCAEVISQVDNKFVLVRLEAVSIGSMLVLIDQHAADERIRIEALLAEYLVPAAKDILPNRPHLLTALLDKPLTFEVSLKESRLLHKYKEYFSSWGIVYDMSSDTAHASKASTSNTLQRLTVRALPPSIVERCKIDPRLLIDLIRSEAWTINDSKAAPPPTEGDWLLRIHSCPQGILDMLNSRACRSAIMFNDELTKEQCQTLVAKLALCKFPFQCAHGRPSLVPLVDLGSMEMRGMRSEARVQGPGGDFGAKFRRWRERVD